MGTLPRSGRCEVTSPAAADAVWAIVSDPTRTGEWSHECSGGDWVDGATGPVVGARFRGRNRVGRSRWTRVNEVVQADAPHTFSWRTVPSRLYPDSTVWTFTVEPTAAGTRIEQRFEVRKLNPVIDRIFYALIPQHRDRSQALLQDLERLAEVAAREPAPAI